VKLYSYFRSSAAYRVRIALNLKGLAYDTVPVHLTRGGGEQLAPGYRKLNPQALVPALQDGGRLFTQSLAIIEYLDEIEPGRASFTPRDPVRRAAMRSLMRFIDEMPAAAVRVPTFNLAFLPRFQAMSEDEFVAFAESKPLRKEFMLAMGRQGFPEKDMNAALDRLKRTYARMDQAIEASAGPWLLGRDITLADVAVMPALVRMADLGLAHMWAELPRVQRWYEAICAHRAFKPTYYSGSLLTEKFPHLKERSRRPAAGAG